MYKYKIKRVRANKIKLKEENLFIFFYLFSSFFKKESIAKGAEVGERQEGGFRQWNKEGIREITQKEEVDY